MVCWMKKDSSFEESFCFIFDQLRLILSVSGLLRLSLSTCHAADDEEYSDHYSDADRQRDDPALRNSCDDVDEE